MKLPYQFVKMQYHMEVQYRFAKMPYHVDVQSNAVEKPSVTDPGREKARTTKW